MKFKTGNLYSTPGAIDAMQTHNVTPLSMLARHMNCDWGDIDPGDKDLNEMAMLHGDRILSIYQISPGRKLWVITEADRSSTTILLPEEY